MQYKIKKNKRSFLLLILCLIALILVAIGIFLFVHGKSSETSTPIDKKGAAEVKQDLNDKQDLIKNPDSQDAPSPPQLNENSISISTSQTTSDVTVFTKLGNIGSGSCTITITNAAKTYRQTVPVVYQPEFSSCAGYTISKNSVNGAGVWSISLVVTDGQSSATKTSTVKVN